MNQIRKRQAFKNCVRFETLVYQEELTDEEIDFILDHQERCELGIHTDGFLEKVHNLPQGTLRTWDGISPLPQREESNGESGVPLKSTSSIVSRLRDRNRS